ncbi:hypothetical protein BU25DRAFT_407862 [Macroventuria anomochaeta]|uniref:Uncharacterized protein n=1 Tax=Macroventuria anomochaeta TaxID=301207 RepID=A0ACB6SAN0_9PLEO|nr:uncharacterized protein BU25DRAFT_407862 [Macroventuria anomochaeta]KAF2630567.1 hypothetical protein BU25DRAFT_407862 [Macroventuria anomochaeta]
MAPQLFPAGLTDPTEHIQSRSTLASFPHLSDSEFDEACSALLKRFELHAHRQNEWTAVESVSQNETTFLRITKPLALHPEVPEISSEIEEVELREEDDEVVESSTSPRAVVHYDVVLSPSYRVPVMYCTISDTQHRYPPTMETLYSYVIPLAFRPQAEHVGVIGGITVTVRLLGERETNPS